MAVSFVGAGAAHQWFQGSTMVSGEWEVKMTALPIRNALSIRKLKTAINAEID